jgi:FtsP/CotA-like multicopper oxidase with cupredoxin domain
MRVKLQEPKVFLLLFLQKKKFLLFLKKKKQKDVYPWLALPAALLLGAGSARAQEPRICPARPSPGTEVQNPPEMTASGGILRVALTLRSLDMSEFPLKVCYAFASPGGTAEAPTLRLSPGDTLDLTLSNRLSYTPPGQAANAHSPAPHDPCTGGEPGATSTNLGFGSLAVPPLCHQGEHTTTTIENTDAPFRYRFRIPDGTPPGLYLYRPHLAGSSALQVGSGASGVLVIGGMAKSRPDIAGLPERILVFRQQFDEPGSPGDVSRITVNFQPVGYRHRPPPVIRMRQGASEFWRVANAAPDAFLALRVMDGPAAQRLRLIALDGVPTAPGLDRETIEVPPGGRAEFIVAGPEAGHKLRLVQTDADTGPAGAETPPQVLATILAAPDSPAKPATPPSPAATQPRAPQAPTAATAAITRHLYFAEASLGTNGPTRFFLTVEGQTPKLFDPAAPPAMVTRIGATEDWIIGNRTGEAHAFTLQAMHFRLLGATGVPETRDTVTVPAWDGTGAYPSVRLRLDFTGKTAAGRHIAECSSPDHEDAGMLAAIEVQPN